MTYQEEKKKKLIIFGSGKVATRFLVNERLNIDGVFDNNKVGDRFWNITITRPMYNSQYYIIIATQNAFVYGEIKKQLCALGYTEFNDFIPYTIYKKKLAVAYGNCHMSAVKSYLEQEEMLQNIYGFYPLLPIQNIEDIQEHDQVFERADLFLYQPIRKENRYGECYVSINILPKVSKKAKCIAIPNLYGMPGCLFPQLERPSDVNELFCMFNNGVDIKIYESFKNGMDVDAINHRIMFGGFYSDEEIQEGWNEFIDKLIQREQQWDIKISDYILDNYKTEKLFAEPWHIMPILAREIAQRTLYALGIKTNIDYLIESDLDIYEVFIYEDVKRALGIEYTEKYIRKSRFAIENNPRGDRMSIEDYLLLQQSLFLLNMYPEI